MADYLKKRQVYEGLCDLQIPTDVSFSPNAQQVLYSTGLMWSHKTGKNVLSTLWIAQTGKPESSRQITSGLVNDRLPKWSPDGQSIAFISDRAEAGKKSAIYVLNLHDSNALIGEPFPITSVENERSISSFAFSPDGKKIAFVSADEKSAEEKAKEDNGEDPQVWGENLLFSHLRMVDSTTKQVFCATASVDTKSEPERHVLSFAWSPNGEEIAFASTSSPDIEEPWKTGTSVFVLTVEDQSIRPLCSIRNYIADLTWSKDGTIYFKSGMPLDSALSGKAVYSLNPRDSSFKVQHTAFGMDDDASGIQSISGAETIVKIENNLNDQLYLVTSGQSPRLIYTTAQTIGTFAAAYPSDSDEILLAFTTSNINTPGEVYTTTASGGALVLLSAHGLPMRSLHSGPFGTCTHLTCPSSDNEVSLDALLLKPNEHIGPGPTLVLLHGGPDTRLANAFSTYYMYWAPYMLLQGYTILIPNYRGSSGKGHSFSSYNAAGCGQQDHADVLTMTSHAIFLKHCDPNRIVVGGMSQGGWLSYLSSTRNGLHPNHRVRLEDGKEIHWKFAASIPMAGITDTDAMTLTSDLGATVELDLNGGYAPWLLPKTSSTASRVGSALWEVSDAVAHTKKTGEMVIPPMLILHGEKDDRTPITQAWGMRRALEFHSRGEDGLELPYEFVTYPRQPHMFTERFAWVDVMGRIERWCEKYIGEGEKSG